MGLGICLKNIFGLKNIPPIVQISKSKHHSISTLNHKEKKNHQKYGVVNLLHSLKVHTKTTTIGFTNINALQLIPPLKKNLTVEKSSALLRKNFFSKEKQIKTTKNIQKRKVPVLSSSARK